MADLKLDPELELRAGPLAVLFDARRGALRSVRVGGVEAVRGAYMSVRETNWDTVESVLSNLEALIEARSFEVEWDADCDSPTIGFRWHGRLTGSEDGVVTFEMRGAAKRTYRTNRTGLCALHPASASGAPCRVTHADGSVTESAFPKLVSPRHPFENVREIAWQPLEGVTVRTEVEGDYFGTEDQRNWTDASFKTFCRDHSLPRPFEVKEGETVSARLRIAVEGDAPEPPAEHPVHLALSVSPVGWPEVGMLYEPGGPAEALRDLRLKNLHVALDLDAPDCNERLAQARSAAGAASAHLTAHVKGLTGHPERALLLAEMLEPGEQGEVTVADETTAEHLAAVVEGLRLALGKQLVVSFAPGDFDHLNRSAVPALLYNAVGFDVTPQEHAFDARTILENASTVAACVRSAREANVAMPVLVGPVRFRSHFRPPRDPRQTGPIGVAYTVALLASALRAQADRVCLYATAGSDGVFEPDENPLERLLGLIGHFGRDGVARAMRSTDEEVVDGFALGSGGERAVFVTNRTPKPVKARFDASPSKEAEAWSSVRGACRAHPRALHLRPYESLALFL